ncbi:MAG: hypothetical protein EXQ58_07845 [Acidobacteria bacterium]|nr:hypothetical protein [Acidobacteriota bacterium]
MSTKNRHADPDLEKCKAALGLLARRALELGIQMATLVYIFRYGKIVDVAEEVRQSGQVGMQEGLDSNAQTAKACMSRSGSSLI